MKNTQSLQKDKSCQMLQATFRRCVSSWCFKPESIFEGKHFAMLCLKTFPFPHIDFCVALRINKTRAAVSVSVCVACPCRLSDYKTTIKCLFCASRFHTVFVILHVKQTCFQQVFDFFFNSYFCRAASLGTADGLFVSLFF